MIFPFANSLQCWPSPQIFIADNVKVYQALLTQNGTANPSAAVLFNSLGFVVLNRSSPGNYQVTFPAATDINKVAAIIGSVDGAGDQGAQVLVVAENTLAITTFQPSDLTQLDDVLSNTFIQILVYP